MLRNPDPEGYMCDKLLDMMEDVPFYKIKVTEFCRFAGVSRSAFYAHFDSIYDVIQKIEDDFFDGLVAEDEFTLDAVTGATNREITQELMRNTSEYLQKNLRVSRILLGENGEPSFSARLGTRIRRITERLIGETGIDISPEQRRLLVEYATGGQLAAARYIATHSNGMDADAINDFTVNVIIGSFNGIVESNRASTELTHGSEQA